jgi:hypothetical protein
MTDRTSSNIPRLISNSNNNNSNQRVNDTGANPGRARLLQRSRSLQLTLSQIMEGNPEENRFSNQPPPRQLSQREVQLRPPTPREAPTPEEVRRQQHSHFGKRLSSQHSPSYKLQKRLLRETKRSLSQSAGVSREKPGASPVPDRSKSEPVLQRQPSPSPLLSKKEVDILSAAEREADAFLKSLARSNPSGAHLAHALQMVQSLPASEIWRRFKTDPAAIVRRYGGSEKDMALMPGIHMDDRARDSLEDTISLHASLNNSDSWLKEALLDFVQAEARIIEKHATFFKAAREIDRRYGDRQIGRDQRILLLRAACGQLGARATDANIIAFLDNALSSQKGSVRSSNNYLQARESQQREPQFLRRPSPSPSPITVDVSNAREGQESDLRKAQQKFDRKNIEEDSSSSDDDAERAEVIEHDAEMDEIMAEYLSRTNGGRDDGPKKKS